MAKNKHKKPKKSHSDNTITVGDDHNRMEIQRQNQQGLILVTYNKHLLDSKFDYTSIRLEPDDIIKLRNECNIALDSGKTSDTKPKKPKIEYSTGTDEVEICDNCKYSYKIGRLQQPCKSCDPELNNWRPQTDFQKRFGK